MSNRCSDPSCLNGNCAGCSNGNLFCDDPRCFPNCPDCTSDVSTTSNNWIIIVIILVLLGILLILSFIIGFDWFKSRKKAAEPKELTVNRHHHSVVPPQIVVNSPQPTIVSQPKVSCEGVELTMAGLSQTK